MTGYEIHIGRTEGPDCDRPFAEVGGPARRRGFARRAGGGQLSARACSPPTPSALPGCPVSASRRSGQSYGVAVDSVLDDLADHLERHLDVGGLLALARCQVIRSASGPAGALPRLRDNRPPTDRAPARCAGRCVTNARAAGRSGGEGEGQQHGEEECQRQIEAAPQGRHGSKAEVACEDDPRLGPGECQNDGATGGYGPAGKPALLDRHGQGGGSGGQGDQQGPGAGSWVSSQQIDHGKQQHPDQIDHVPEGGAGCTVRGVERAAISAKSTMPATTWAA